MDKSHQVDQEPLSIPELDQQQVITLPGFTQSQPWENKTWYDFDDQTIKTWDNCDTPLLEELCPKAMADCEYWLCGNVFFRRFYSIKKSRLAIAFTDVLIGLDCLMVTLQPQLRHEDKQCKCWEYITKRCRWVYKADSMILREIKLDYKLHPEMCWFAQIVQRYCEWNRRFDVLNHAIEKRKLKKRKTIQ